MKRFAETIFADQGNPVGHAFYLRLFAVPDQSTKNAKIIHQKNLALYGIFSMYGTHTEYICSIEGYTLCGIGSYIVLLKTLL